MANFNKVILIGRLTSDIDVKQTANATSVCNFCVAVSRRIKNGNEAETDFFDCTAWKETAEFLAKWFKKGDHVLVEGELMSGFYLCADGKKIKKVWVNVKSSSFVDQKKEERISEKKEEFLEKVSEKIEITNGDDLPF